MRREAAIATALAIALALPVCAWANDYEDYDEWTYEEPAYASWVTPEEFWEQGVIYADDGTWYTYYNDEDWPDGFDGYLDEQGVWRDWDGYVAVAAEWWQYGEIVDTPLGPGRVYDICPSGAIDVWTCWE